MKGVSGGGGGRIVKHLALVGRWSLQRETWDQGCGEGCTSGSPLHRETRENILTIN